MFDQDAYHDFVLDYKSPEGKGVVGFFPEKRKLASGRESGWYWNGRVLLAYERPLLKLADFVLSYCQGNGIMPDYFLNVPEGVNMLTNHLNIELGGRQVMVRANPKTHGDPMDAQFIGPAEKGDKVVIVEDVTTTGGSLMGTLTRCLDANLDVIATLCECNRMECAAEGKGEERVDFDFSVAEYVSRARHRGVQHHALTDAEKIVPAAFELWTPEEDGLKEEIAQVLKEEYEDHGIIPMELEV
ncbi:MAG: hypothetical protein ISS36_01440 [Candidatus Aenigmarchaeota archaeon]|nr:hypothetical protein [Candidatus Aenigmarchaeota archaeon]